MLSFKQCLKFDVEGYGRVDYFVSDALKKRLDKSSLFSDFVVWSYFSDVNPGCLERFSY